jgi:hypothetical protein
MKSRAHVVYLANLTDLFEMSLQLKSADAISDKPRKRLLKLLNRPVRHFISEL